MEEDLSLRAYGSYSLRFLAILATFYTLYFASSLLVPIFLAFLLYFLLIPIVIFLKNRLHIPPVIGSALLILVVLFIVGYAFYFLSLEARGWASKGPDIAKVLHERINALASFFKRPIEFLSAIFEDISNSLNLPVTPSAQASLFSVTFTNAWSFFIEFFIMLIVLYFLLASKNFFLTKIVKVLLHIRRQKEANEIIQRIESQVWHYLFIRTITNVGVAVIVTLMLWLLGLPNPLLWGIMAGILEYMPFIGAFISTVIIFLVSLITFDTTWRILLPPIAFVIFITLEGNLFVPYLLGRRFTMNKVAIVFAIFLFGMLWGVMGSFLAIPLLMIVKIILDNIDEDNFLNKLLEE